ncbi:hypothetical protein GCM10020295_80790 [Streptomyces cinereospinus]
MLGDDGATVENDYFHRDPIVVDAPGTYADASAPMAATVTVEWRHGIGDVVSAPDCRRPPHRVPARARPQPLPSPRGKGIPQVYSLRAAKTA